MINEQKIWKNALINVIFTTVICSIIMCPTKIHYLPVIFCNTFDFIRLMALCVLITMLLKIVKVGKFPTAEGDIDLLYFSWSKDYTVKETLTLRTQKPKIPRCFTSKTRKDYQWIATVFSLCGAHSRKIKHFAVFRVP